MRHDASSGWRFSRKATVAVMGTTGERDLSRLVVAAVGAVRLTDDPWSPVQLRDESGQLVSAVAGFMAELQGRGRAVATQRSYAMDLLRWFRFLWAVDVVWDQATRVEARDFCRWLAVRRKPRRAPAGSFADAAPMPAKRAPSSSLLYAATTRAHTETVLRSFYDFHLQVGTGPLVNPFPLARDRRSGRAHAHHNPMDLYRHERAGLYRPQVPQRIPRCIPEDDFNRLFARLGCDRDRALVALWVSTGARARELLGVRCGDVDPGQQVVTVIRKGSRALQQVPASADAFIWLRLYQCGLPEDVPKGRDEPVWWTRRRPLRPLTYQAARAMFTRAGESLGGRWTLHDLRHTAAYRMARDPLMPLTDVQWVLGHAQLSTTQLYINPLPADVIADVLAHHQRRAAAVTPERSGAVATPGLVYREDSLRVLFQRDNGQGRR